MGNKIGVISNPFSSSGTEVADWAKLRLCRPGGKLSDLAQYFPDN